MTAADVDAFFDAYAAAFTRFDVDRICALWAYPALIAGRGKSVALDAAAFRSNSEALCAFYRGQGVGQARVRVCAVEHLTRTVASVVTEYVVADANDAEIARWRHAYLLSETANGVRAVAALPDGELDAWEARGVKLGAW